MGQNLFLMSHPDVSLVNMLLSITRVSLVQNKCVFCQLRVHFIGDSGITKTYLGIQHANILQYLHELNGNVHYINIYNVPTLNCAACKLQRVNRDERRQLYNCAAYRLPRFNSSRTMDPADTHAVDLKLPVFWVDHPRVWLLQAFAVRNVTADKTKYHYVVAALDQATALRVIDVLEDPPQHDKYENLKRRLTYIFGLSRRQRADQLLDIGLHSLGDRRPSQLMDELLALLGSHKTCMLFESIFLRCMPEDIRLQLATSSFDDLRALAKTADEFWQAKEQSAVVFASNTRTKISATRKPVTTTSSGESPARDRNVCYYHQRFGDAARKCVQPCAFAGNDRAGRQ